MSEERRIFIISQGTRFRECIEQITFRNGKKTSRTYHEEKQGDKWVKRFSHKTFNVKKKQFKKFRKR